MEKEKTNVVDETIHLLDYVKIVRKRLFLFLFLLCVVSAVGLFIGHNQPRKYTASATIKINPVYEETALDVYQQRYYRDNYWLATEFELIKSDKVLEKVISEARLNDMSLEQYYNDKNTPTLLKNVCNSLHIEYRSLLSFLNFFRSSGDKDKGKVLSESEVQQINRRNMVKRLRSMVNIKTDNETRFVALQVTAIESPKEAQVLTNALVKAYGDYKVESKLSVINEGLSVLRKQVEERDALVMRLKSKVNAVREKHKLTFMQDQVVAQSNVNEVERLKTELAEARIELAIHQQTLEKINKMTEPELEEALGVIITDSQGYLKLKNELNESVIEYELLRIDLGENHQKIKRAQKRMTALRKQMDDRLAGVKSGFKLQYEKAKARVDQITVELDTMTSKYSGVNARHVQEFNTAVTELKAAQLHLSGLREKLRKEEINIEIPRSGVTISGEAVLPLRPSSPNFIRSSVISLFFAFAISLGLVFFLEYLNTSIKSVDELEKITNIQSLTTVPQKTPIFFKEESPTRFHEETYRILYTNLSFVSTIRDESRVVAFTSSGAGEGKSTTSANFSYVASKAGKNVLIIDADLHRPVQHSMTEGETVVDNLGLIDLLTNNAQIDDVIVKGLHDNLSHIYAGANFSRFAGLINSAALKTVFEELRQRFELIIIDCPPILGVNDSALIASLADDVILVVKDHGYPSKNISRALQILNASGANVVGTVLNNAKATSDYYGTYYYSASKKS